MTHALQHNDPIDFGPGFYPIRQKTQPKALTLEPPSTEEMAFQTEHQQAFDQAFPPIRNADQDVLIISWAEIERQFLDLSAPWDQDEPLYKVTKARQMAAFESPEKTFRWLMVLAHTRTDPDTPEPNWGTGESYPMP